MVTLQKISIFTVNTQRQVGTHTILAQEPFATYRNYINAHRVIIKSVDSGVSFSDPPPIVKDTPLGMNYFVEKFLTSLCR